jgi:uroporphyrinogen-III synthase
MDMRSTDGVAQSSIMIRTAELPLFNWRVLVTRPADQAQTLARALERAGATCIVYPTIGLEAPPSWAAFENAVRCVGSYSWIVFTSPSSVRFALGRAPQLAAHLRSSAATAVAAVGTETARAAREYGVPVAVVPEGQDQRQEGLVAALGHLPPGSRVLFPQAIGGRELLREALTAVGATVDVVPVSRTVALPLDVAPPPFDAATFASPSALRAFVAKWTVAALQDKVVAVMGPTTRDAALAAGVTVHVVPSAPSVEALVAALGAYRLGLSADLSGSHKVR